MAVTPHYSWPIPVATDYVKDGWDAIADLGNAIDTTVYGLSSGALTYISGSTFSAQSNVIFDNVFTSTYANYKIIGSGTASGSAALYFYLRSSGTDLTSSVYLANQIERTTGGFYSANYSGTNGYLGASRNTGWNFEASIYQPQLSANTFCNSTNNWNDTSGSGYGLVNYGNVINNTNAYDGIKISVSGGTFTGTIRIYGIANS